MNEMDGSLYLKLNTKSNITICYTLSDQPSVNHGVKF